MEQIIEVKSILKNKNLLSVFAESVYNPTEERLNKRADKYIMNPNTAIYATQYNNMYKSIIVLDISNISEILILDIAVSANYQRTGIGSSLINHCIHKFEPNKIVAETDDDAVGFYKKLGFNIVSLGDKYGVGITRYKCTLKYR